MRRRCLERSGLSRACRSLVLAWLRRSRWSLVLAALILAFLILSALILGLRLDGRRQRHVRVAYGSQDRSA